MDYGAGRTAEHQSKREIVRRLKRYVACEVYHALTHCEPTTNIVNLSARRNTLGHPDADRRRGIPTADQFHGSK
jgi:hypothetical protein